MATADELSDAYDSARLALLKRITRSLEEQTTGSTARDLAEAYAWITSPSQSHGGQGAGT